MSFNRIRISKICSNRLTVLGGKTRLTPNILCRIGFSISLSEPSIPNPLDYEEDGQEFNRYTLMGDWDVFIIALLKERLLQDGLKPTVDFFPQFRAHLNRGVILLFQRVKGLPDLVNLLPDANSDNLASSRGTA